MTKTQSYLNSKPSLWPNMEIISGLLLCLTIAFISYLSNQYIYNKISALLWAFVYSIVITNLFQFSPVTMKGINFASGQLLRISIAFFGFTVSALAWIQIGWVGGIIVLIIIAFALLFGLYMGRVMGLNDSMSILIAAGTGICGASAIAAIGPSINAKEEEMGMAVACITLFGLSAMFLYPLLFQNTVLGAWLYHSSSAFGLWAGTGIHETAQVVGAASLVNEEAMGIAMAAKSVRIFAIVPVVVIMSTFFARNSTGSTGRQKIILPFFAAFFVLATLINTLLLYFPETQVVWGNFSRAIIKPAVTFLLAVAFAGVGGKVRFKNFASLGIKAFVTGLIVALLTGVLALILVIYIYIPFNGN